MDLKTMTLLHFGLLAFWGGVVATEAVLELYPFRHRNFHRQTVAFHYWIDLLVELPALCAVVATGLLLIGLTWPLSGLLWLKIACAGGAVTANAMCILLVVRRKRRLSAGASDEDLWSCTRRIVLSAKIGLPLGIAAAALGLFQ